MIKSIINYCEQINPDVAMFIVREGRYALLLFLMIGIWPVIKKGFETALVVIALAGVLLWAVLTGKKGEWLFDDNTESN